MKGRADSVQGPTQAAAALRAEAVTKRFDGILALDGVSLDVRRAECVALVGESGSGKTTLLRCFNRLIEPDSGSVHVGEKNALTLDPIELRRHLGYVPQEGGLLPHWRVARNVALVPWLRGSPDAPGAAERALAQVGLPPQDFAHRWPRELSGGQRQRVAIARALAADPEVVLLDEPFGALDAITRAELHDTFLELRRSTRLTMLLVTHDLAEALKLADRIGVMRRGRVEQFGDPREIVGSPATEYVAKLLRQAGAVRSGS